VPQGISTAPAWFVRMVLEVLKDHAVKDYAAVLMDGISIYSDMEEEHGQHIRAVMNTLRKYNFKVKGRKCTFGRSETKFVGYRISSDGIRLLERKISSIISWPMVASQKDTQIFLGLVGAYRKFIPNLGKLAVPLNTLTALSKPEFDKYMMIKENQVIISDSIHKIKSVHWVAITEKELTAEKFADIFVNFYICLHSLPDIIISDRDSRFNSRFWKYLTQLWETKLAFSTTFHPQTDGQAEKANSIVRRFLRAFSTNKQRSWDALLAIAEFAYNSHRHQSTGISPFEADRGYIPRMPLDSMTTTRCRRPPRGHPEVNFSIYMADILKELEMALAHAQEQQIVEANSHR
jgi:hypothetical protein